MNGGYVNGELGQLQATMQTIEIACSSIQINVNPLAAEATILSLCQSARPYQACQFIIENSQMANARFQAATAIRDAAIREWSILSHDEKKSLISFCLSYVMKHASSPEGYVLSKISSVAAQLMKRGWLELTAGEKDGFFSEISMAVSGNHGLDVQFIGINFLESLVSEFSPSTSTAMSLPREFHEQCKVIKTLIDEVTLLQMKRSREALLNFSAEHTQGKIWLNVIVKISLTTLVSYPGETDLQAFTCYQLLGGVVRRKNICQHLVTLEAWRELAHCFANDRVIFSLNASHQRSLAQTLVLSASGIKNSVEVNQYIWDLTNHMTTYLNDISGKKDIKSVSQQPDVILAVSCLLERLRGASSASEPRTQKPLYEMGFSVMQSILKFLEVYKDESAVVYLLLKLVVEWVEGQIIYLEPHETAVVIDFCMHLLQLYSSHNIGKISISVSSSLQSEANAEKYRDLRALLQLLQKLCTKDMVDVSSAANEDQQTSISQVIYVGVHIVSPLITTEMLKYPKLCYDYFALLSHMLEVYPEMIPKLNHEAFSHISGTLVYGLHQQDEEVVGMCLRSLRAVAIYHYKERGGGRDGLGPHATTFKDNTGTFQDGILSKFLRSLLQLILFEDYSTDLVGAAADALFPLILCDHDLYQRLCNELVERQQNTVFKTRMVTALHSLTTSDDLSPSADRANMRKFRKNLNRFLIDVRGFLRVI